MYINLYSYIVTFNFQIQGMDLLYWDFWLYLIMGWYLGLALGLCIVII